MNKTIKSLTIFLIFCFLFCLNDSHAMEPEDPPIFKIVVAGEGQNKVFYLMGSPHSVPLRDLFSEHVINILNEINKSKAILYIEHDILNDVFLKNIEENKVKGRFYKGLLQSMKYDQSLIRDFGRIKEKIVNLGIGRESTLTLDDINMTCPIWLAAPILSIHAATITYPLFGGTEYDFLAKPNERESGWVPWQGILYLEDITLEGENSLIKILENARGDDQAENKQWLESTLKKLIEIYPIAEHSEAASLLKEAYELQLREYKNSGEYSWKVVEKEEEIQVWSVRLRNDEWVKTIVEAAKHYTHPLLIVVGWGHLIGNRTSLLHLLRQSLNAAEVYRLTNDGHWIRIDQNW